jgi:nitrate reductase cytochrome c-type subunit
MNRWLFLFLSVSLFACGGDQSEINTERTGGLLLNETHGDNGLAWGLENCADCHAMTVIHKDATETIRGMVRDKGYQSCTGCHGNNGTTQPRECLICHNESDLPADPYLDGRHSHVFTKRPEGGMADEDCLVCHDYSDMNGEFDLNLDLTKFMDVAGQPTNYSVEADFCLRCHNRDHQQFGFEIEGTSFSDPLIALEEDYEHVDYHGWRDGSGEGTYKGLRAGYRYPQVVDCSDCHALHGTNNEKLIIDSTQKGARLLSESSFLVQDYQIEVTEDGDYSQLCVICHAMQWEVDEGGLDTGNGLSGVHLVGDDCRPCHTHGEASQVGL